VKAELIVVIIVQLVVMSKFRMYTMASRERANEWSVWEHMEKKENGKAECRLCKRLFAAVDGNTVNRFETGFTNPVAGWF